MACAAAVCTAVPANLSLLGATPCLRCLPTPFLMHASRTLVVCFLGGVLPGDPC